jgi:hypothetical protein
MTTFHDQLVARARATHARLDTERRTLVALANEDARAQAHLQALGDEPRVSGVFNAELDAACKAASESGDRRRRQESLVSDLETDCTQLDTRANSPENFAKAAAALTDVRAAVATIDAKRQKSIDKTARLRGQLAAEHAAAAAGRAWQKQQLLARIEGIEQPDQAPKPEHPPEQHEQATTMISEMVADELAAQAQIDREIDALKGDVATAEAALLEQSAYMREVEYAEALADFAPAWTRFKAAHLAAFDFAPAVPNLNELAGIGLDEALIEARQVLVAGSSESLLRRGLRKLADTLL